MRLFFVLAGSLLLLSSATCKKTATRAHTAVDSLQLNRLGGFVGFSDHYMIYPGKVLKDTVSRDLVFNFDHPEPSKIAAGKELLSSIPQRMWQENNKQYGITVADGIDYTVTAYKNGDKYYWVIRHDPPAYVQPYTQKIHDFFSH